MQNEATIKLWVILVTFCLFSLCSVQVQCNKKIRFKSQVKCAAEPSKQRGPAMARGTCRLYPEHECTQPGSALPADCGTHEPVELLKLISMGVKQPEFYWKNHSGLSNTSPCWIYFQGIINHLCAMIYVDTFLTVTRKTTSLAFLVLLFCTVEYHCYEICGQYKWVVGFIEAVERDY